MWTEAATRLWGNSLANNGQMGTVPRSASVSLPEPPVGWTISSTHALDFAAGSFGNMEVVTHSGLPHLRCSHADGNLAGVWTGPIINLGSVAQRICYAMTGWLLLGVATTWEGVFTGAWQDIGPNRPWQQVFETGAVPGVRMRVEYGDTAALGKVMERMEILSAVLPGQYFRLVIEITDPQPNMHTYIEPATLKFGVR